MTLLTVTSFTWMVTGLGFGLVLLLLFLFVYIMKLLGVIMQPHKQQNGTAPTTAQSEPAAKAQADADDQAAVAYALHLYYNSLHDIEPVNVTLHPHTTSWNSKSFGINNLHF